MTMSKFASAWAAASIGLALASPAWASSSITRTSSFAYDAASGLLTQEVVEPNNPALRLQTDTGYDAYCGPARGRGRQTRRSRAIPSTRSCLATNSEFGRAIRNRSFFIAAARTILPCKTACRTPLTSARDAAALRQCPRGH
jgi:hypothetical protein